MDFRARKREQARHRKLGTFVLVSSAFCGLVATGVFGLFVPIPFAPWIVGVFAAIAVHGVLKKAVGYDQRIASAQHLIGDPSSEAGLPSRLLPEPPVYDDGRGDPSEPPKFEEQPPSIPPVAAPTVVTCPRCRMKVVPKADGTCPSCQSAVTEA